MEYISAHDAAEKWGISQRRVSVLCSENRITGAARVGNMWVIPKEAVKPEDARRNRNAAKNGLLRPFVKWAGGKGQLLDQFRKQYPAGLGRELTKYAEPFVGGGAVLFDIIERFKPEEIYISDSNSVLINTYQIIRDNVNELIKELSVLQNEYTPMNTEDRKKYYNLKRERYNNIKLSNEELIEQSALFVFLNKTCFNGLYRVNRKGLFNVPMGAYKKPCICDQENLTKISRALENVRIVCGDYRESFDFIDNNTFVYLDPPYRPLTETANFTAYTENSFDDTAQLELAEYIDLLDKKGAKVLVSNADPKNADLDDGFFDELYKAYKIKRVAATRMINCNSKARGKISELLITNY